MQVRIPKASRKSLIAFLALSLTLHLLVCRIPGSSHVITNNDDVKILQVSLVSVAAPSVVGNSNENKKEADKQQKTETEKLPEIKNNAAEKHSPQKTSEQAKSKNFITSNDLGNDSVTVAKTLSEDDYIQTVAPIYPARAIDRGFEGTVIVKALISNDGAAKKIVIADSSGHQILDSSAMDAVSKWKFKKSAIDENIKEMWVQVPVKFIIR